MTNIKFGFIGSVILLSVAMLVEPPAVAQHLPPEEKEKKIEFGESFDSAWDLYQHLVDEADGGMPLTRETVPEWTGVYRRSSTRTSGSNFDPDQMRGDSLPTAKLTPAGHASMMKRVEMTKQGIQFDPISSCSSPGMPRWLDMPFLRDFAVTPDITYMNAEAYNSIRRIYTDGRDHLPKEEQYPVHNGDSVEPPRVYRRLQTLRNWSHEYIKEIFSRDSGKSGSDGI